MGKTVRISLRTARAIASHLDTKPWGVPESCGRELRREIASCERKSQKSGPRRKEKAAKRLTKKERRSSIRDAVMVRSRGVCECGCGAEFEGDFWKSYANEAEMDHFFGRSRSEELDTCWALTRACHRLKTAWAPDVATWCRRFIAHAERNGYRGAAERARGMLERKNLMAEAGEVAP